MSEKRSMFHRLPGRALRSGSIVLLIVVVLLGSLVLLPQAKAAQAAGLFYFVDATSGNDSNDGRSEGTAWKSITKVNSAVLNPGDQVLFKRGGMWRTTSYALTPSSSGTEANPILFGAYGSGPKPILTAALLTSAWSAHETNTWKTTHNNGLGIVAFDGIVGNKQSGLSSVDSDKDWYWENNALYVFSIGNPSSVYTNPGVEASFKFASISTDKSYLIFENLDLRMNNDTAPVYIYGGGHITVRNCDIGPGNGHGIYNGTSSYNTFQDNQIHDMTGRGIYIDNTSGPADFATISGNTIQNCPEIGIDLYGDYHQVFANQLFNNGDGIYLHWSDHSSVHDNLSYNNNNTSSNGEGYGIGVECSSYNEIYQNDLYQNGSHGIEVWGGIGAQYGNSDYNRIYNNKVYANANYGIAFTGADNTRNNNQVFYNLIFDNTNDNVVLYSKSSGNKFFNNVVDGGGAHVGLYMDNLSGWEIRNNIFSNAKAGQYAFRATTNCDITHSNNIYYMIDGAIVSFNGTDYDKTTIQSFEPDGKAADPSFVDRSGKNFRLASSSPAIDTGIQVGLNSDLDGNPVSNPPDCGAFESNQVPTPTPTPTPTPVNPTISGRVTKVDGSGMNGVTLTLSNSGGSVVTSGGGYYSLTVAYGWSRQVTPSYASGSFSPSSRDYGNLTSDQVNQDYSWTAPANPTLSGRVTQKNGAGLDDVVLNLSNGGGKVTTSGGGYYTVTVPYGWSGKVTPSYATKGVFTPSSKSYSNVTTNKISQNYSWSKK